MPIESTVLDFAFRQGNKIGLGLKEAYVNGIPCSFDTKLKNGSIVAIKSDNECRAKLTWKDWAVTNYAKIKIEEALKEK